MRRLITALILPIISVGANAELSPISDQQMSEITGQAFVSVDRYNHPSSNNDTTYTRVNLGMDVEAQVNIKNLELGRYERNGEKAGTSDLKIENFGLGYIEDTGYYGRNPDAPRQRKDGSQALYKSGEIVPFKITDPYLEFAYDESDNEFVGFRVGFGGAQGVMTATIKQLTGNINVNILDRGEGLEEANSNGNGFDKLVTALAPVLAGSSPLKAKGELVQGDPNRPNYGEPDPVRGEYVGVANGKEFLLEDVNYFAAQAINIIKGGLTSELRVHNCTFLVDCDVTITAMDCMIIGIEACFPIEKYNSLPIGKVEDKWGTPTITGPAAGVFISFQAKDLEFLADIAKTNPSPEDFIKAAAGTFFNIPNGAITVNLPQALNGTEQRRVEYIDRGVGLF